MEVIKVRHKFLNQKATEKLELVLDAQPSNKNSEALSEFERLKMEVIEAKEPGREEYIAGIKSAVASGKYKVSDDDLIEALFQDGFAKALNSF